MKAAKQCQEGFCGSPPVFLQADTIISCHDSYNQLAYAVFFSICSNWTVDFVFIFASPSLLIPRVLLCNPVTKPLGNPLLPFGGCEVSNPCIPRPFRITRLRELARLKKAFILTFRCKIKAQTRFMSTRWFFPCKMAECCIYPSHSGVGIIGTSCVQTVLL